MSASFSASPDGVRIAYDVNGSGTPIILLHGGLMSRQSWHTAGYTDRLKHDFRVIAIDLRGNGESDKPTRPQDYHVTRHCEDILAVADACGIERFVLWGYSLGGNIGRVLAAQSSRVTSLIMIGVTFGPGAPAAYRKLVLSFHDHWLPILQAQRDGSLDVQSLSREDQELLQSGNVPLAIVQSGAMLEWGSVEPKDVRCPTLWLAGSRNEPAMAGIREYEESLMGSRVQVHVIEGLDHSQEFSQIDEVLPVMISFTRTQ